MIVFATSWRLGVGVRVAWEAERGAKVGLGVRSKERTPSRFAPCSGDGSRDGHTVLNGAGRW